MRFLLDEDVNPRAAEIARGRGIDVRSVRDLDRLSLADEDQLRYAAREERAFVARNRDDFRELTVRFFETREPHAGVLILPFSIPNRRPELITGGLEAYSRRLGADRMQPYTMDFLRKPTGG